jgi:hypothetical protein
VPPSNLNTEYAPSPLTENVYVPAPFGVAGEHPVQVAGPQPGLVPAGAGTDLDDHALVVVGVTLDHREADLLLKRAEALPRSVHQRAQLRVIRALFEQFTCAGVVVGGVPVLGGELRRGLKLAVRAAGSGEPLAVADDLGVGELGFEVSESRLNLGYEVVDHGYPSVEAKPRLG